ncbi:hypothetical protein [Alkalicoccobacillus gibsonii]|uniref:hypothetical protein n=1 Tax=Alkalicoccobacillus gibsonii TaxID=79881 RepID=UPI001AEE033E|nr:hypothetical protein [Alkalicoccobacillus gibsonii]
MLISRKTYLKPSPPPRYQARWLPYQEEEKEYQEAREANQEQQQQQKESKEQAQH